MEPGDNVLCTVKAIEGTTVFVHIEDDGDGTIVVSEIAPGRIRNLRDYVVPNKKIVCKVLEITESGNVHLSLRRVNEREYKEVIEKYEREKNSLSILRSVVKEKAQEVVDKIKKDNPSVYDFLQFCKTNPKQLEKHLNKEDAARVCQILSDKKDKLVEVKKEFSLKSEEKNGMLIIKEILMPHKEKVSYLASGKFVIKITAEDYKKANQEVQKILTDIENKAKKDKAEFSVSEK